MTIYVTLCIKQCLFNQNMQKVTIYVNVYWSGCLRLVRANVDVVNTECDTTGNEGSFEGSSDLGVIVVELTADECHECGRAEGYQGLLFEALTGDGIGFECASMDGVASGGEVECGGEEQAESEEEFHGCNVSQKGRSQTQERFAD